MGESIGIKGDKRMLCLFVVAGKMIHNSGKIQVGRIRKKATAAAAVVVAAERCADRI